MTYGIINSTHTDNDRINAINNLIAIRDKSLSVKKVSAQNATAHVRSNSVWSPHHGCGEHNATDCFTLRKDTHAPPLPKAVFEAKHANEEKKKLYQARQGEKQGKAASS